MLSPKFQRHHFYKSLWLEVAYSRGHRKDEETTYNATRICYCPRLPLWRPFQFTLNQNLKAKQKQTYHLAKKNLRKQRQARLIWCLKSRIVTWNILEYSIFTAWSLCATWRWDKFLNPTSLIEEELCSAWAPITYPTELI